jgi:2,3-bisphosphoglycerate-dependent phosphoglycerate mutase
MNNPALILFRHGNTFETGETARYVGAGTDLSLTAQGEQQATQAAEYVVQNFIPVEEIITGPLKRTQQMATIIAGKIQNKIIIDNRLCEIHFGEWENKTREEIAGKFGKDLLAAWEQEGTFPENMNWSPAPEDMKERLQNFLDEQHKKLTNGLSSIIAVTSNGVLRTLHALLTSRGSGEKAKVATGHFCVLEPKQHGWQIMAWNVPPNPQPPTP